MKLSVSILSMKDQFDIKESIKKLNNCNIDFLHIDIMDGKFVKNSTWNCLDVKNILPNTSKPLDIHLMVEDIEKYINDFSILNPKYITFHLEATDNPIKIIKLIKEKNIGVGISIKPNTDVSKLLPYLSLVDLVLVMSVEPGQGGQKFLDNSVEKINYLYQVRNDKNYNYVIEVDGGVNNTTIENCRKCDIVVVGSYITKNNYEESIKSLNLK